MKNIPEYNKELSIYQFKDRKDFTPNYSPIEMINEGIFGGNYFGNVEVDRYWTEHVHSKFLLEAKSINSNKLIRNTYDVDTNKYKVKCGMDYRGWIDANWIKDQDPYGWFNWYINFYYGRRSVDDNRQIGRWKSFIPRHSGMLKSMCIRKNKLITDESIGLKTRQGLLHWAYKIT
jgi:hypothetical protein